MSYQATLELAVIANNQMIRIVIADDHAIVRNGLKQIIEVTPDMAVVGEASNGADLLQMIRKVAFDLLLLDMDMPGISGLDLIKRLRADNGAIHILILSMHNETQLVNRALKAGVSGYVTKDSDHNVLLSAIRAVASGEKFIDPALVNAIVFDENDAEFAPHDTLTDRELQVLMILIGGQNLKKTADSLHLSAKTISTHKAHIMKKLGISNNTDLIRYSIKHGLIHD